MYVPAIIAPAQFAYMALPSRGLREFVDSSFSYFAKFPLADGLASGWGHRYRAGHDLFLDVPATTVKHGLFNGYKHAGHILLTDFPTKAGIPIPGFSQSGLGRWLEAAGISRGWLNLNVCDAGVGVYAVSEGSLDLMRALDGSLQMDEWVFFDTFVEGSLEIALAVYTENPILLVAGVENILAGVLSAWDTVSVYVDPFVFFGSSVSSAFMGFLVGYYIAKQSVPDAIKSAIRSGTIGALFAISPAFGFAAISGLLAQTAGKALAQNHRRDQELMLAINKESIRLFVEEVTRDNPRFENILKLTGGKLASLEAVRFPDANSRSFNATYGCLCGDAPCLISSYEIFTSKAPSFSADVPCFSYNQESNSSA